MGRRIFSECSSLHSLSLSPSSFLSLSFPSIHHRNRHCPLSTALDEKEGRGERKTSLHFPEKGRNNTVSPSHFRVGLHFRKAKFSKIFSLSGLSGESRRSGMREIALFVASFFSLSCLFPLFLFGETGGNRNREKSRRKRRLTKMPPLDSRVGSLSCPTQVFLCSFSSFPLFPRLLSLRDTSSFDEKWRQNKEMKEGRRRRRRRRRCKKGEKGREERLRQKKTLVAHTTVSPSPKITGEKIRGISKPTPHTLFMQYMSLPLSRTHIVHI